MRYAPVLKLLLLNQVLHRLRLRPRHLQLRPFLLYFYQFTSQIRFVVVDLSLMFTDYVLKLIVLSLDFVLLGLVLDPLLIDLGLVVPDI